MKNLAVIIALMSIALNIFLWKNMNTDNTTSDDLYKVQLTSKIQQIQKYKEALNDKGKEEIYLLELIEELESEIDDLIDNKGSLLKKNLALKGELVAMEKVVNSPEIYATYP